MEFDFEAMSVGKPMYLNLWASYCGPCVKGIPDLQAIEDKCEIAVVSISVDVVSAQARAAKILQKRGASYKSFYLVTDTAGLPRADLERLPIPTTLVLSPEGVLERVIRTEYCVGTTSIVYRRPAW